MRESYKHSPLNPPAVADILRSVELRCGYILGTCKDTREMRLEAEGIKRLVDRAFKGMSAWWHAQSSHEAPPHLIADEASQMEKSYAFNWLRGVALGTPLAVNDPDTKRLAAVALDEWHACKTKADSAPSSKAASAVDQVCGGRCDLCYESEPYSAKSLAEGTYLFHAVGEYQLPCRARDIRCLFAASAIATLESRVDSFIVQKAEEQRDLLERALPYLRGHVQAGEMVKRIEAHLGVTSDGTAKGAA